MTDREGCLSFPELYFPVPRATRVVVKGTNVYGEPVIVDSDLTLARYLQHEVDHLDGILFIDRMDPNQQADAMRLIRAASPLASPPRTSRHLHTPLRDLATDYGSVLALPRCSDRCERCQDQQRARVFLTKPEIEPHPPACRDTFRGTIDATAAALDTASDRAPHSIVIHWDISGLQPATILRALRR